MLKTIDLATLIRQLQSKELKVAGLAQFDQLHTRVLELRDEEALSEVEIQEEVNAYRREK